MAVYDSVVDDDLLLFGKGDVSSIMVLLRAFATFSTASALYSYWVNIFIIPKGVLSRLNAICRSYLWDGKVDLLRVPLVSWEKLCAPKKEGGLGVRDSFSWNVAAMRKLVWWIYYNPNNIWVKWVHQVYLKGTPWSDYTPTGDISWGWKSVCRVRDKMDAGYHNVHWLLDPKGYTINSGYELLRKKLRDEMCLLCGTGVETHDHLFHQCPYSKRILSVLATYYDQVVLPSMNLLAGIWNQKRSVVQQKVVKCAFMAEFYYIWMQRNQIRVEGCLLRPDVVVQQIRQTVRNRIRARLIQVYDRRDIDWLSSVSLMN
ncbi:uncharacterized protein LOC141608122 [Silene latifolia]|uniref:uncharacterized protein LOC141608122 n=1 Tax=Silene latifolia TaxID=37657 RepID=UPI003D784AA9